MLATCGKHLTEGSNWVFPTDSAPMRSIASGSVTVYDQIGCAEFGGGDQRNPRRRLRQAPNVRRNPGGFHPIFALQIAPNTFVKDANQPPAAGTKTQTRSAPPPEVSPKR